jgi:transposase-like protein
MSRAKRRRTKRTYAPAFKQSVVARVQRGRANRTETQRQIAAELGLSETLVSSWVTRSPASWAQRSTGKKTTAAAAPDAASPTIELRGLRAWVNHAVRLEVERILAEKRGRG